MSFHRCSRLMQKASAVSPRRQQITALACAAYFTSRAAGLDDPFLKDNDKSSFINLVIVPVLIDIPSLHSMCLQTSFERNGASCWKIKREATFLTNLDLKILRPSLLLSAASLYQSDENKARILLMVELLSQYLSSMIPRGTCCCLIWS